MSAGVTFASEDLMDYFYQSRTALRDRCPPCFRCQGWLSWSATQLSFVKSLGDRLNLLRAFRAESHGGAENVDGPLFQDKATFGMGAALVWSLYESAAQAHP